MFRRFRFLILGQLVLLWMLACSRPPSPQESCAFVQNEDRQRVSWNYNLPVKIYVHESVPVDAYGAIDEAIAQYNNDVGRGKEMIRIVARGASGSPSPARDGYSMIYWMNTWDSNRKDEQARTTIHWTGNQIFEADMMINASQSQAVFNFSQSATFSNLDLTSLVVHELGHVMGLAHNSASGSVMAVTLDNGQTRRKLGSVDLNNLRCEY